MKWKFYLYLYILTAKKLFSKQGPNFWKQMIDKCQPLNSGIEDRDFANVILSIAGNC